jgi:hypothetical protein
MGRLGETMKTSEMLRRHQRFDHSQTVRTSSSVSCFWRVQSYSQHDQRLRGCWIFSRGYRSAPLDEQTPTPEADEVVVFRNYSPVDRDFPAILSFLLS